MWSADRSCAWCGPCVARAQLYFYHPLPPLASLDPSGVHVRMRCYTFPTPFTEHHLAADSHHELRRACGAAPERCNCASAPKGCPKGAVRVEDAFAIVPRPLGRIYFASHVGSVHDGLSKVTHDYCPPWASCAPATTTGAARQRAGCHSSPECRMTHSLLTVSHAHVVPSALHFAIARTRGRKWGAGARLGPLYLSSPLVRGAMDALANVTYRCRGAAGKS